MIRHSFQKFFPRKLRAQMGLIISLLLASTISLYAWHMSREESRHITYVIMDEASVIAKSIANQIITYVLMEDYASLETHFMRMAELPYVLSISACDGKGNLFSRVIRARDSSPVVSYSSCDLEPPGDSRPFTTILSEDRIIAWHPISEGALLGWVRIDYSLQMVYDSQLHIWRDGFIYGFMLITVGIVLILFFLNPHIRAVGAITDFAKRLDERKGGTITASDGSLETEQLVFALNQTSQRLHGQDRSLKESEKKYRTLFEESKDAIFFSTFNGRFVDINQAGVELFGYSSKEELLQENIGNDVYVDSRQREEFTRIIDHQGFIKDYEIRMKRKNGDQLIVLMTATAVHDEGGSTAFRGILRDVTSERKLEAQLRHVQKLEAVGQLTGGIAHDFNNILSAIIGFAYVLKSKLKDDRDRSAAELILGSAQKAVDLTQGLLTFSSKQTVNPRPIEINEIVNQLSMLLSKLIGDEIELKMSLTPDNPVILADSGQMDQVLMNLAANARDAMPSGGSLIIETQSIKLDAGFIAAHGFGTIGNYVLLSVTDTGPGMDEETAKHAFEPFFTTKEVGKGTGLGLSIVYGIVKQHSGYITIYSEPGMGTTFKIFIPIIQAEIASQASPEPVLERGGTEMILMAEDNKDLRTLTRTVLCELGYRLIEAVDGTDAVEKFLQYQDRIDLLLLDVTMPGKNGKEVYDEIKKIRPGIKVLFISAHSLEILRKRGLLSESIDFLSKPVSPPALLNKIREVLDRPDKEYMEKA